MDLCGDGTIWNDNDGQCVVLVIAIGDTHRGGIVFYLDGNGGGLIAAPADQSTSAKWSVNYETIVGAYATSIGTGAQNTQYILNTAATPGIAANICSSLDFGGYADWFLPSKDELNEMYENIGQNSPLGNVGGFETVWYWSSTEFSNGNAEVQHFNNGLHWGPNSPIIHAIWEIMKRYGIQKSFFV